MIRYLGYACQNLSLCEGRKAKDRFFTDRTLRMDRFSIERVGELGARNAADLLPILKWNVANGIRFFRIGSGMFARLLRTRVRLRRRTVCACRAILVRTLALLPLTRTR